MAESILLKLSMLVGRILYFASILNSKAPVKSVPSKLHPLWLKLTY